MNRLKVILQKEFTQIFRNKAMLPIIFVVPIIQLLILVNAADFEIRNIRLLVNDADHSQDSRRLTALFEESTYFTVTYSQASFSEDMHSLDKGDRDMILQIRKGFADELSTDRSTKVMLHVDGMDGQKAMVSYNYARNIIDGFSQAQLSEISGMKIQPPMDISTRYWYNPELEYKNLMVPGLLAVLVSMVGMFLSSMNIVVEKEIGTIEQLNVTPITKFEFIAGKLLPFWFICLFELSFGLLLGWLIFNIPVQGSLLLLFSFAGVYFIVMLGFGLLISTFTFTQQQAMFISWFFMVVFILMGGIVHLH